MSRFTGIDLNPKRVAKRVRQRLLLNPSWQFMRDISRLIREYKLYSLAILGVTVVQEVAALWPVALLGQFVDRLQTGDLGNIVWLLMGASLLAPGIARGNVMLRHKMFYDADFQKRAEMLLKEADRENQRDVEDASATHTRVINAVSGIVNATHHILGSFTPVIVKVIIVLGNLLAYNRSLGMAYLASLSIPALMTILFNGKLRVLRDAQYSVVSKVSGAGVKVLSEGENLTARDRFKQIMRERKEILISLICKSQFFLYVRQASLVGSQFIVVFLALQMRTQIGLTPGDFTKLIGYTAQVAVAFINTAACLDAIISYSRAYHVFAASHKN